MIRLLRQLFKRKLKSYLVENQYKVVEAFKLDGVTFYMFEDPFKVPAGRGMAALTIYEEFNMRTTREYLEAHVRATELLINSNPIKLTTIAQINQNLKERLQLALFPDHIYKLASVIFFDQTESPYNYDYAYNAKKIEKWKAAGGTLDFFLKTPLKDLMPSIELPAQNVDHYFQTAEKVDELHRQDLQEVLSKKG